MLKAKIFEFQNEFDKCLEIFEQLLGIFIFLNIL